jgi:hypothetical protein
MYKKIYYFGFVIACAFVIGSFVYSFDKIMKKQKESENVVKPIVNERENFDPCCPCLEHGLEAVEIKDGSYFCAKCIE